MPIYRFLCGTDIFEYEMPTKAEAQFLCLQEHGSPCVFQEEVEIPPAEEQSRSDQESSST